MVTLRSFAVVALAVGVVFLRVSLLEGQGPNYKMQVLSPHDGLRVQTDTAGGQVGSFGGLGIFDVDAPGIVGGRLAVLENGNVGIGVPVPGQKLSVAGTIDTYALPFSYTSPQPTGQSTWAVNIGQDGTGVYYDLGNAYDIGAKVDDVGIWRRALTANEAKAIYVAGQGGKDLSLAAVPVRIGFTFSAGVLHLSWIGSPPIKLQTTTSLHPVLWTDVPGTLGASSADIPFTNSLSFFKLSQ